MNSRWGKGMIVLLFFWSSWSEAQVEPRSEVGPRGPTDGAIQMKKEILSVEDSEEDFEEEAWEDSDLEEEAQDPISEVDPQQVEWTPRDLVTRQQLLVGSIAGTFLGYGVGHAIQKRYYDGYGYAYTLSEGVGYVLLAVGFGDCGFREDSCDNKKEGLIAAGAVLYLGARLAEIFDIWYYYFENKEAVAQEKNSKVLREEDRPIYRWGLSPETQGLSLVFSLHF